jgi:ribonuclease T1
VKTPGARDRGARRIVAGAGVSGDARPSGEYYYSDDHYNSFRRIRE